MFESIFRNLNVALEAYVMGTASNVIGAFTNVASSLLLLYMVLWGWAMLRGMISEPITDGLVRIVRLSLIVGIALSASRYNTYVVNFLWETPDALARVVAGAGHEATEQFLDSLWSRVRDTGNRVYERAQASRSPIPDFGLIIGAWVIWIAGAIATGYAAFLTALAKMALAILLSLGPIFILLLIFDGTRRFFDAWAGQTLNFVFLAGLAAAAVRLLLGILDHYLGPPPGISIAGLDEMWPIVLLCAIAWLVMMQLPSIASALGGGIAVSTLGAAGWAYQRAKGAAGGTLSAMRPRNIQRSYYRLRTEGRIVMGAARATKEGSASLYRRVTGRQPNRIQPSS